MCLAHPQHGYYMKKDPLGVVGDFTTAPEISQLFGEMIGIWAAEEWHRIGKPSKLHLAEFGPGRGTLMSDLLRIAAVVPEFAASLSVHLVETSPALKEKQNDALSSFGGSVAWHETLDTVPDDAPLLCIGNEFLDALPIRQYVSSAGEWYNRLIGYKDDAFCFVKGDKAPFIDTQATKDNTVFEVSPVREQVIQDMVQRIKQQGGSILMIDYGNTQSAVGETFQAVRNHQYTSVLGDQGDCDLTSHVDFSSLASYVLIQEMHITLCDQNEFLNRMGVSARAQQLKNSASVTQAKDIDNALNRLLADDEMGTLFKVMEVRS